MQPANKPTYNKKSGGKWCPVLKANDETLMTHDAGINVLREIIFSPGLMTIQPTGRSHCSAFLRCMTRGMI